MVSRTRTKSIVLMITEEEYKALVEYAEKNYRSSSDQGAMLLRKALIDCNAIKLPEHRTGRD